MKATAIEQLISAAIAADMCKKHLKNYIILENKENKIIRIWKSLGRQRGLKTKIEEEYNRIQKLRKARISQMPKTYSLPICEIHRILWKRWNKKAL